MKKYLNLELIMTMVLMAIIGILAIQGVFVEHLSQRSMTFPTFVFSIVAILGVVEITRNVLKTRKKLKTETAPAAKPEPEINEETGEVCNPRANLIEIIILTAVYCVLLWLVGFVVSSVALVITYGLRRKYKKPWVIVVAGIAIILVWYFLFTRLLGVSIFPGILLKGLF